MGRSHRYDSLCNCVSCKGQAEQCQQMMKAHQMEPRYGGIPTGPLDVTQYMQPQRFAYRLAAGLKRLLGND